MNDFIKDLKNIALVSISIYALIWYIRSIIDCWKPVIDVIINDTGKYATEWVEGIIERNQNQK